MQAMQPSWDLGTFQLTQILHSYWSFTPWDGNASNATFLGLRNFSVNSFPSLLLVLYSWRWQCKQCNIPGTWKFFKSIWPFNLFGALLLSKAMQALHTSSDLETFHLTQTFQSFWFFTFGNGNASNAIFLGLRNFLINSVPLF